MKCDHSDQSFWIGRAGGVFCQVCGAKIDTKALSKKAEPAKDPEPEVKTPVKKAPAKKTTAKGGKK